MARPAAAVGYTLVGQGLKLGILFTNLFALSRLLSPADFGVVALGFAIVGFGELLRDFGLSAAVIQATDVTDAEQSNLFWLNTALGGAFGAVAVLASWPAAELLSQPALDGVVCGLGGVFLINGMQTQYQARLSREYRFGILATTDVLAQAIGLAIGIILALEGAGAWALVGLQVCAAVTLLVSRVLASKWRPRAPQRDVSVRRFLRFGIHLGLAQLFGYFAIQIPVVVMGYLFGAYQTGLYSRASQLVTIPISQVFGPLTNVALATLSRKRDPEDYGRTTSRLMIGTSIAGISMFVPLAALSEPIVDVVLGERWSSAVPILVLLAAGTAFQGLTFPGYWLFLASGETRSLLAYNAVTKVLLLLSTLCGLAIGEAIGMAAGYALGLLLSWPICVWWLGRVSTAVGMGHLLVGARLVCAGGVSGLLLWWFSEAVSWWPLVEILVGFPVWCVISGSLVVVLGGRRDLTVAIGHRLSPSPLA